MTNIRILPAGGDGLLLDLGSLEKALVLLAQIKATQPYGLLEAIPAAQTVLVRFDPNLTTAQQLRDGLSALDLNGEVIRNGRDIEIPVHYDGEDLEWLANHLGMSVPKLIARHEAADFSVAFTGFAPGFAYMKCSDPALIAPRRSSPRIRIPASSVAMAGEFCGIYPSDSPGGWQLLGHTPYTMWDLSRPQPALLLPGDRVKFRDIAKGAKIEVTTQPSVAKDTPTPSGSIEIIRADRPILLQDLGRPGLAAQGVSRSGALDRTALFAANRAVGNPREAAALEISFGGVALTASEALTFAIAGAPCPVHIQRTDGQKLKMDPQAPLALNKGERLIIGTPSAGVYSYLALRGGYKVEPILKSASYDSLAKLGPAPLQKGDHIDAAHHQANAVTTVTTTYLPKIGNVVTLDVIEGPRDDWFSRRGLETLYAQAWQVSPQSSRTGKRLSGEIALERSNLAELPSEGTVPGAIQVPHSGQPVLFLADHPLTGGYPVIAVVAPHHLDLAAQIPPGAKIRFSPYAKSQKD